MTSIEAYREGIAGNASNLFEQLQAVGFNDHAGFDNQLAVEKSGVFGYCWVHGVTPLGLCYLCSHYTFDSATMIIHLSIKSDGLHWNGRSFRLANLMGDFSRGCRTLG
jgi:hypothetical protein